MFATRLDKIILTQVMRRENKGMKLLSLLHYMKANLTSFPPKCFFQKNRRIKSKNSKRFSTV